MTQLRHNNPAFTGFESDGDSCFFYVRGCEHTYWNLDAMTRDDIVILLDTLIAFYTRGTEAAREMIDGENYVPPEKRPEARFRVVTFDVNPGHEGDEPLGWDTAANEWTFEQDATPMTEAEALAFAESRTERCRVEEIFA